MDQNALDKITYPVPKWVKFEILRTELCSGYN